MSQVSTTTAMTTTPLVTVVSSGVSSLSLVTMAPSLIVLPAPLGQCNVVLLPLLTLRCPRGVIGLPLCHSSNLHLWCHFRLMPIMPWVLHRWVSFSELSLPPFSILYVWCLFWCLLSTFRCHAGCHIHSGAQPLGWSLAHTRYAQSSCCLHYLEYGESSATQSAVPQPSLLYGGAYSFGGLTESHPIHLPSLHGGEGSCFPGLVPSVHTVDSESAIGIKPGDSGVVIGYQVDEFTHTWSAEQFVAHSPHLSWVRW